MLTRRSGVGWQKWARVRVKGSKELYVLTCTISQAEGVKKEHADAVCISAHESRAHKINATELK